LVLIAPMLIGVPVAATPGLVPQEDVETVPAEAVLDPVAAALLAAGALDVDAALPELELEELHAARTPSDSAATAAAAVRVRQ
jgi:hypothetical protein